MRTITRYAFAAILAVMCTAGAASGLPVSAQSPQETIAGTLAGLEISADAVELLPDEARVTYEQSLGGNTDEMMAACLRIMETVTEQVPGAIRVIVYVDYIGEPLLEIRANAADVRALVNGSMEPDAFADRLWVNDHRLPEQALRDNMVTLGIWESELRLEGLVLHITFAVPDGTVPDELPAMALQILGWVAGKTAGLERTYLHAEWPDGTVTDVGAAMADVLAWRLGTLEESDLTARLDRTNLPVAGAPGTEPALSAAALLDPLNTGP